MKIRPVGAELLHADGRTDRQTHDETNSRFYEVLRTRPKVTRSAHIVYLCVLCGSQNKQRLFPYTALTDWFL
jgi:ribosomal protein L44E